MITNKMNLIKQISWRRISQSEIRNSAAEKSESESRRAKIPSPQPPSFLPACWKPPAIFSDGDGTSNWVAGGVNYLNNNTTKQIPKAKYKTPNIRGIHNST